MGIWVFLELMKVRKIGQMVQFFLRGLVNAARVVGLGMGLKIVLEEKVN